MSARLSTEVPRRVVRSSVADVTGRRDTGPALSVWRPWAGSLHALTIIIITKYTCIYIYFYTL